MVRSVVTRLRDYLAARDLSESESAGGLAVGHVPDVRGRQPSPDFRTRSPQHAGSVADSERPREPRLAGPLPPRVAQVARANLVLFGALAVAGVLFVAASGVAVIAFPLVLGRDGVGRAMITLFLCCAAAVSTGLLLLAARSAARIIRRERRGVASLIAFLRFGAVMSVVAGGIVWWLSVAFFEAADGAAAPSRFGPYLAGGACFVSFAFFVWGMGVLRAFRKTLGD